jgi:hypothetical protein
MHLSTIVIGDVAKPRRAHGFLGLELEIIDRKARARRIGLWL